MNSHLASWWEIDGGELLRVIRSGAWFKASSLLCSPSINHFRTPAPFWGQLTYKLSTLSPHIGVRCQKDSPARRVNRLAHWTFLRRLSTLPLSAILTVVVVLREKLQSPGFTLRVLQGFATTAIPWPFYSPILLHIILGCLRFLWLCCDFSITQLSLRNNNNNNSKYIWV